MKKLYLLFIMLTVFLFLCGCGGGSDVSTGPTAVPNVFISGNIVDSSTGNLMTGQNVTLSPNQGAPLTTNSGGFSFSFSSNANYLISTEAAGFKGSLVGGVAASNKNIQILLSPEANGDRPFVQYIQ